MDSESRTIQQEDENDSGCQLSIITEEQANRLSLKSPRRGTLRSAVSREGRVNPGKWKWNLYYEQEYCKCYQKAVWTVSPKYALRIWMKDVSSSYVAVNQMNSATNDVAKITADHRLGSLFHNDQNKK